MKFIKAIFYTALGSLMTIFYREGMDVAMSWMFIVWLPFAAHDLGEAITPFPNKKATGSGTADDQEK